MSAVDVFDDGFDVAHAFDSDPGMMNLVDDRVSPPAEGILSQSTDSIPSWIGDIENMLMNDDDVNDDGQLEADDVNRSYFDEFLCDILLDFPADVSCDGHLSPSDEKSPQSDVSDSNGGSEKETSATHADAMGDEDRDDPNSKKRKRQLRNKDAALRSRERKKMYLKDLELKSRYLEGECRRLGRLLQCCYAENQDLRFRLHVGDGAAGAAVTKQESAVLLLESLLLGSLFWFLGIICLFHLPKLLCSNKERVVLLGTGKNDPRSVHLRRVENNIIRSLNSRTLVNSRRCRALRTKMKLIYNYTAAISILA
ncbi:unnamed protein product [Rhodiola kirilowii]